VPSADCFYLLGTRYSALGTWLGGRFIALTAMISGTYTPVILSLGSKMPENRT